MKSQHPRLTRSELHRAPRGQKYWFIKCGVKIVIIIIIIADVSITAVTGENAAQFVGDRVNKTLTF